MDIKNKSYDKIRNSESSIILERSWVETRVRYLAEVVLQAPCLGLTSQHSAVNLILFSLASFYCYEFRNPSWFLTSVWTTLISYGDV